jgi:catalase (peroxidase I)
MDHKQLCLTHFTLDVAYQYSSVDAPTGKLMMLPSDLVLLEDKGFLKWVNVYAKDANKFNKDFTVAFQKLEELGTKNLTPTEWV